MLYVLCRIGQAHEIEDFDYIVVGAGPAGCVIAAELVSRGKTVALLEQGEPTHYMFNGTLFFGNICDDEECNKRRQLTLYDIPSFWRVASDYKYGPFRKHNLICLREDKDRKNKMQSCTGIGPGGNTSHFQGFFVLPPREYWDKLHMTPTSYDWIVNKVQDTLRPEKGSFTDVADIEQKFIDAADQVLDLKYDECFEMPSQKEAKKYKIVCNPRFFVNRGLRSNPCTKYLAPLLDSPRLKLLSKTEAIKLEWSAPDSHDDNWFATGVFYRKAGKTNEPERILKGKKIILSGGLLTAKILNLSGIGMESNLKQLGIQPKICSNQFGHIKDHYSVDLFFKHRFEFIDFTCLTAAITEYITQRSGILSYTRQSLIFALQKEKRRLLCTLSFDSDSTKKQLSIGIYIVDPDTTRVVSLGSRPEDLPPMITPIFLTSDDKEALMEGVHDILKMTDHLKDYLTHTTWDVRQVDENCHMNYTCLSNFVDEYVNPNYHYHEVIPQHMIDDKSRRLKGTRNIYAVSSASLPLPESPPAAAITVAAEYFVHNLIQEENQPVRKFKEREQRNDCYYP